MLYPDKPDTKQNKSPGSNKKKMKTEWTSDNSARGIVV